ncbi:hypothetical protein JX266_003129 [Neoarthrinium moseri]|nr:uncharacterized protein JN550_007266 [Neoarthrinium moseri]KAI1851667.1 hypothetical protein JX266_003129 [Neoarthrinium moseri]KAI1867214.1 hypothetical protein JN550_007266 [Neoarthrinium moseri]
MALGAFLRPHAFVALYLIAAIYIVHGTIELVGRWKKAGNDHAPVVLMGLNWAIIRTVYTTTESWIGVYCIRREQAAKDAHELFVHMAAMRGGSPGAE